MVYYLVLVKIIQRALAGRNYPQEAYICNGNLCSVIVSLRIGTKKKHNASCDWLEVERMMRRSIALLISMVAVDIVMLAIDK